MDKTIYSGYVIQEKKLYQFTDDKDTLSSELRDYNAIFVKNFSFTDLLRKARELEAEGHWVEIQIGDMYYRTVEK